MKFVIIPLILTIIQLKSCVECIECKYMDIEIGMYGCEVLKDLFNQTRDAITGDHYDGKTDDDVVALFINAKSDYEFSQIYCKKFQNLKRIHIERVELAKRDDFKFCKKAQHLLIVGTELWWLPEDVFGYMEDLRILEISMNRIVYLPRDLIINNRRLEKFIFQDNKIQVVDMEFPSSLKEISLEANQCIDRRMPSNEAKNIEDFNRIVVEKCGSSILKRVKDLESKMRNSNDRDVMNLAGSAFDFTASITNPGAKRSSVEADVESYKNWFIFLSCFVAFLIVGWGGTAFVLMRRLNDLTHGDQHYLVSMDTNDRREFLDE